MLIQLTTRQAMGGSRPAPVPAPRPWEPVGTELTVRPARPADMAQVAPLIATFAARNLMLPKSHDQLVRAFREFVVVTDAEQRVLACGALRVYSETLAEIVSLAVGPAMHGRGLGRRVVERLVEEARDLGLTTLFALTLQQQFFARLGFRVVPKELFPLKVWADCRSCSKLHACDEIAVAVEIAPASAGPEPERGAAPPRTP